jgi:hypothetical protein
VLLSAVVGSVTLIPGFVAFPMAAMLLGGGAGAMQIGAFVSSLMMVGVVTFPIETRYFGKKTAAVRNLLAFFFSFAVAYVIGRVVARDQKNSETIPGLSHFPRRIFDSHGAQF